MTLIKMDEPRALEQTIDAIQKDGVVAFPTDTVYGIAASVSSTTGLQRIFEAKGRTPSKTLPVLVSSPAAIEKVAESPDPRLLALATRFWPGALTVVVPGKPDLPPQILAADGTVGVRVPNHSIALIIAERCGGAIAVTSANPSGQKPALSAQNIQDRMGDSIDIVLDAGTARGGVPSSVIRLDGDQLEVLRDAAIPAHQLREEWNRILELSELS